MRSIRLAFEQRGQTEPFWGDELIRKPQLNPSTVLDQGRFSVQTLDIGQKDRIQ